MPDAEILSYYDAIASKLLPFLRGRRVGVRHTFDHTPVFRRHWPSGQWIRIEDARALREIVRRHGYEFFPHLESENDLWFALDIDVRAVPLALGTHVVRTALDVLEEREVKYLLTFSGSNGFHVRWEFASKGIPHHRWQFLRRIVRSIQSETESRLQGMPIRKKLSPHIPKGDPLTELSAADKEAQHSILFDELILKPQATIRAPFSAHMKHRWVAIPLDTQHLSSFQPERDATMEAAKKHAVVQLPRNSATQFLKAPWV